MKLARWLVGISCAVGIVSVDSKVFSQSANQVAQRPQPQWSTVQSYCFGCHNEGVRAGNLFLDKLGPESVSKHHDSAVVIQHQRGVALLPHAWRHYSRSDTSSRPTNEPLFAR